MTRIKMNTIYAGPSGTCNAGQHIHLEEAEADALVNGRYAEYAVDEVVAENPIAETADLKIPETAEAAPIKNKRKFFGAA